jgi:carbamoyl-phosphate synthase large subunit
MEIAYSDRNIVDFMSVINLTVQEHPILVDKYLMGRELEVDGVFDGENILIPGIMEHIERAGIHSGDSISVYPPLHLEEKHKEKILRDTYNMAKELGVIGLINAQYILYDDDIYVIEVNPRSSRTIPYISKVTGVPIIELATRVMLGEKLADMEYGTGIYKEADYFAVKMPVFSFEKLNEVDIAMGPEMKSTGECLGIADSYPQALLKAFKGANMKVPKRGGRIIVTVKDEDKGEITSIARGFQEMGIEILATKGTCDYLNEHGVEATEVKRISEGHPNIEDMIRSGSVDLIINTPAKSHESMQSDGFKIRRCAVEHSVPCVTAVDTAQAMLTVREFSRADELVPIDVTTI